MENKIEKYLKELSNKDYVESKDWNIRRNTEPCSACGKDKFVQLFRNVVGKISGSMSGSFYLFGGSVSGRIDGYTKTLPVLSCSNCKNERKIKTFSYQTSKEIFWYDMSDFYFGVDKDDKERLDDIKEIYLANPLDTYKYAEENKYYNYDFYNEITEWSPKIWAEAGFKIEKIEKKGFFRTKQVYPKWEDLIKL